MKIRTDKDILRFLGISLGMILLGLITLRFQFSSIGVVLILCRIILMCFFTAPKPKENFIKDDRFTRINEKAGYHTF